MDESLESLWEAGADEGTVIPPGDSFTGKELDYSRMDDVNREVAKKWQAEYTRKRQPEVKEIKELREKLGKFDSLLEWDEYKTWAKQMLEKFPEGGSDTPGPQDSVLQEIEGLKDKVSYIDDFRNKQEISEIQQFAQANNLPTVEKSIPLMDEILEEITERAPDKKTNLSLMELYLLAISPDLIKMIKKIAPPTYVSSSGRDRSPSPEHQILAEMAKAAKTGW